MATPHRVDLHIQTTADVKPVQAVTASVQEATVATNPWITASRGLTSVKRDEKAAVEEVSKAVKEETAAVHQATVATNPWVTACKGASQAVKQVADESRKVTPAVKDLDEAVNKTTGKRGGGGSGYGMLLFGQALEDAQYGLKGVMNNIPGLVTSLGLGAGAAGIIQVALVALSQTLDMLGRQAKSEHLDWSKLTPEEAEVVRLERLNKGIEKQIELVEKLTRKWDAQVEAQKRSREEEQRMAEDREKLLKLAGQADEGDPQKTLRDYDDRAASRNKTVSVAHHAATGEAVTANDQEQLAAEAEVRAQQQEQKVQGLTQRAEVERQAQRLAADYRTQQANMVGLASQDALPPELQRKMQAELDGIEKHLDKVNARLADLPLPNITLTGDDKRDAELKTAALNVEKSEAKKVRAAADEARKTAEEARTAATLSAEAARQARAEAERQQYADDQATAAKVARESGQPEPLPVLPGQRQPLLDPAARPLLTRPQPEAPEPDAGAGDGFVPAGSQSAVDEMATRLQDSIKAAGEGRVRTMLEGLLATLTDNQGNQQEELTRIEQMYQESETNKSKAVESLAATVQNLNEMSRNVAGGLSVLAAAVAASNEESRRIRAEIENIKSRMRN